MSQPTGSGGEGGAPVAVPPGPAPTPPAQPPAGAQNGAQSDPLADHDDGLFDVKDGDPAWIKRLRTQGASYRTQVRQVTTERDEYKSKYEDLLRENQEREQQTVAQRRAEVAKKHGLWDADANDGKGGLLPGIDLGSGSPEEMERVAQAIVSKLRPASTGGGARRPVTVTGTASGTPGTPASGTGRAASAVRELMRNRGARSTE